MSLILRQTSEHLFKFWIYSILHLQKKQTKKISCSIKRLHTLFLKENVSHQKKKNTFAKRKCVTSIKNKKLKINR